MASNILERKIIQAVVTLPVFFILLPVVILVAVCTLPLKFLVFVLAKIFRPDLDDFVTGLSNLFTYYPCLNVIIYWYFDNHYLTFTDSNWFEPHIKDVGRERYQRLFQYCTTFCGYKFWKEDPNFNFKNHCHTYDFTGDVELPNGFTEEDVQRVMSKLVVAPWKEEQSQWETFCTPMSEQSSTTLCIFRHHHAIMDGFSDMALLTAVFQAKLEMKVLPRGSKKKGSLLYAFLRLPYDFAGYELEKMLTRYQPYWQFSSVRGTRDFQITCAKSISEEKIKLAKNKLGTPYSIVLLSILAGGFQRMLEEAQLPVPNYLPAMIPLPVPNHPGGTVNHLLLARYRCPIKANSETERIQRIEEKMKELSSPALHYLLGMLHVLYGSVPASLANAVANYAVSGCSIVTSVLPVAQAEMELGIRDFQCLLGTPGNHIGTTILTSGFEGDQNMMLVMDKRIFPAENIFQNFGKFVETELESLIVAAETTGKFCGSNPV